MNDFNQADLVNEIEQEMHVNGNTLTYGNHTYTVNGSLGFGGMDRNGDGVVDNSASRDTATATVTFTHGPSGYTEFEAVYNGLLGKSIHGTAAMIPMALEIYVLC